MILDIVYLLVGLVLILVGANMLTDGASAIAKRWGVSDLVIGLTVVAFGTSAPELVISIMASINGSAGLAIGNVVGSNIFNVCAIVGVTALVAPVTMGPGTISKDIPLVVLSSVALLAIGNGSLLDGGSEAMVTRVDGILLLLFFAIFMRYTFATAKNTDGDGAPQEETSAKPPMIMLKGVLWVVIGLAGLVYGGDRFVAGASAIASDMGVGAAVIGLTIVAAGTSLPELATSVAAALKGKPGIALGNVIGSNIFNILMVLGISSAISPVALIRENIIEIVLLMVFSVMVWIFAGTRKKIERKEGIIMVVVYLVYCAYIIARL